jgi:uncharacterized membrane protein YraQ (UPF0718 family)
MMPIENISQTKDFTTFIGQNYFWELVLTMVFIYLVAYFKSRVRCPVCNKFMKKFSSSNGVSITVHQCEKGHKYVE